MSSVIHRSNIEIRPWVKRSLTIAWVGNNEKLIKGHPKKWLQSLMRGYLGYGVLTGKILVFCTSGRLLSTNTSFENNFVSLI